MKVLLNYILHSFSKVMFTDESFRALQKDPHQLIQFIIHKWKE